MSSQRMFASGCAASRKFVARRLRAIRFGSVTRPARRARSTPSWTRSTNQVGEDQVERDVRIAFEEGDEARDQQESTEIAGRRHPNCARGFGRALLDRGDRHIEGVDRIDAQVVEARSLLGRRHTASVPMDQFRLQLFLETPQAPTHGRLRHPKVSGCRGEAVPPQNLDKRCNIVLICCHFVVKVASTQLKVNSMRSPIPPQGPVDSSRGERNNPTRHAGNIGRGLDCRGWHRSRSEVVSRSARRRSDAERSTKGQHNASRVEGCLRPWTPTTGWAMGSSSRPCSGHSLTPRSSARFFFSITPPPSTLILRLGGAAWGSTRIAASKP